MGVATSRCARSTATCAAAPPTTSRGPRRGSDKKSRRTAPRTRPRLTRQAPGKEEAKAAKKAQGRRRCRLPRGNAWRRSTPRGIARAARARRGKRRRWRASGVAPITSIAGGGSGLGSSTRRLPPRGRVGSNGAAARTRSLVACWPCCRRRAARAAEAAGGEDSAGVAEHGQEGAQGGAVLSRG